MFCLLWLFLQVPAWFSCTPPWHTRAQHWCHASKRSWRSASNAMDSRVLQRRWALTTGRHFSRRASAAGFGDQQVAGGRKQLHSAMHQHHSTIRQHHSTVHLQHSSMQRFSRRANVAGLAINDRGGGALNLRLLLSLPVDAYVSGCGARFRAVHSIVTCLCSS